MTWVLFPLDTPLLLSVSWKAPFYYSCAHTSNWHDIWLVGKPIDVPKLEDGQKEPTDEQLETVQNSYILGLQEIYDKYKDTYAKDRKRELRIIE